MQHFLWLLFLAIFLPCGLYAYSASDRAKYGSAFRHVYKRYPNGDYFYEYSASGEQTVTGTLKDVNGAKVYSVEGSYEYDEPSGLPNTERTFLRRVKYIADENGYRIISDDRYPNPLPISPKSIASLLGR